MKKEPEYHQYKALYSKKFTTERKDSLYFAKLYTPKDCELENVIEVDENPFIELDKVVNEFKNDILNIFNPANANNKFNRTNKK